MKKRNVMLLGIIMAGLAANVAFADMYSNITVQVNSNFNDPNPGYGHNSIVFQADSTCLVNPPIANESLVCVNQANGEAAKCDVAGKSVVFNQFNTCRIFKLNWFTYGTDPHGSNHPVYLGPSCNIMMPGFEPVDKTVTINVTKTAERYTATCSVS